VNATLAPDYLEVEANVVEDPDGVAADEIGRVGHAIAVRILAILVLIDPAGCESPATDRGLSGSPEVGGER
jgi:hypothetical protein